MDGSCVAHAMRPVVAGMASRYSTLKQERKSTLFLSGAIVTQGFRLLRGIHRATGWHIQLQTMDQEVVVLGV